MRVFLAVDVPRKVKKKITESLNLLKVAYPQFNWIDEENYHVTVYFYGEMNTADGEKARRTLETLFHDEDPFYLYSNSVDLFMHNNITIYLNFRREKKFEKIAMKVREAFTKSYPYSKRYFTPHIALARCRIPSKQQYFVLKKRLEKLDVEINFPVKKITLFESIITQKKPLYKKLSSYSLGIP